MSAALLSLAPFLLVALGLFLVLPGFFGRFFFVLAVATSLWLGSMSHSPDSPGLFYGAVAFCVALAAILADAFRFLRWAAKRRRAVHG